MRLKPALLIISALVALVMIFGLSRTSAQSLALVPSILVLEATAGFESLVSGFSKKGMKATAPATIVGKSGVRHEFAFALDPGDGKAVVVVDTELSVKEVDEMKVLKFYVKVYDVGPKKAVLCVSPRLSDRASVLAKGYGINVLEDNTPAKLIPKAASALDEILKSGDA